MSEKIFRVNMTGLSSTIDEVPEELMGLGGRGLTSTVVANEVPATCHPLGESNKLVFAPGLLSGTTAVNSGRLSVGAKSPLTGTIKESNSGGIGARTLARMGIKALIIEGLPTDDAKWYGIHVTADEVKIVDATPLGGKGNFEVVEVLEQSVNKDVAVLTIGVAGERRMTAANISVKDPDSKLRSLGRGGLGAVMGSKRIKYIALDPTGAPAHVAVADEAKFKAANKVFAKALLEHGVSGEGLPAFGTAILINVINGLGALPTRNFRYGQFDGAEKISGETLAENAEKRGGKVKHGCSVGCVVQCSQVYNDEDGNYLTSGFEYESIWALGANCCIDDLDKIAKADSIMDDIGIDSIETAVAIAVAMEGGAIEFGDADAMLNLLGEIKEGTPLGRIVGNGAAMVGKAFGVTRVPVVKGQSIPAYDPRAIKGIGITFCTTPMGADHTAGYTITSNVLGVGGTVDPLKKEGQVELSRNLQIATAAVDSTGMCVFVAFAVLDNPDALPAIVDMINARFGISLTGDDVTELGKKILKIEHGFNIAAGFTNKDDRLPEFFSTEKIPPHNAVWDFTDEEIDAFWDF